MEFGKVKSIRNVFPFAKTPMLRRTYEIKTDSLDSFLRAFSNNEDTTTVTTKSAKSADYRPVLLGNNCRWLAPHVSLGGCYMDTIIAVPDNSNSYQLSLISGAYNPAKTYGSLYSSDDNEKLYFKDLTTNDSSLIMDLSLSVNDTFITKGLYNEDFIMIVDSVYYVDNLKHIQFNTSSEDFLVPIKRCFIEGFGPNWGFSESNKNASVLICKHEDDELFYSLSDTTVFKDCTFKSPYLDGIIPHNKAKVTVYPNPTNGMIHIESDVELSNVTIYNAFGQLVKVMNTSGIKYDVDLSAFSSGIYFIEYVVDNKKGHLKIIKDN